MPMAQGIWCQFFPPGSLIPIAPRVSFSRYRQPLNRGRRIMIWFDDAAVDPHGGARGAGSGFAAEIDAQRRDLVGRGEAADQRGRAEVAEEGRLDLGHGDALGLGPLGAQPVGVLGVGRAGQQGVHRDAGAGQLHRHAARDRELRGLGHAVVDHLLRDVERRFARHEDDAAPAALRHAGRIVAGEAHAAQDVGLEEVLPFGVGDLEDGLAAVDAEVVHQDVELRHLRRTRSRRPPPWRSRRRCPSTLASGTRPRSRFRAASTRGRVRPVRTTLAPSARQPLGDGEADAGGRAGDQRVLAGESQIHVVPHARVGPSGAMSPSGDSRCARRTRRAPSRSMRV